MSATLLIVDDDRAIILLMKEYLEVEGYQVHVAYDGEAALQMAQDQRPDLIIMDFNMPEMNGLEALKRLRQAPDTKTIPVVFLTGEPGDQLASKLQSWPGVAYMSKPIDLGRFSPLVNDLLQKFPVQRG